MKYTEPKIRYWSYQLPENWMAMAGKTDQDNDLVSFRLSRPSDWWFHVSGMPGSHVLLRHVEEPGTPPPKEILQAAAQVAAFHSKGRGGGNCTVNYCRASDVSKPPRAPAGLVNISHFKNIRVKPELPEDCALLPPPEAPASQERPN